MYEPDKDKTTKDARNNTMDNAFVKGDFKSFYLVGVIAFTELYEKMPTKYHFIKHCDVDVSQSREIPIFIRHIFCFKSS